MNNNYKIPSQQYNNLHYIYMVYQMQLLQYCVYIYIYGKLLHSQDQPQSPLLAEKQNLS